MTVTLTPELEELVRQKVESGQYHSATEIVAEALYQFLGDEASSPQELEQLRREVQNGNVPQGMLQYGKYPGDNSTLEDF